MTYYMILGQILDKYQNTNVVMPTDVQTHKCRQDEIVLIKLYLRLLPSEPLIS